MLDRAPTLHSRVVDGGMPGISGADRYNPIRLEMIRAALQAKLEPAGLRFAQSPHIISTK